MRGSGVKINVGETTTNTGGCTLSNDVTHAMGRLHQGDMPMIECKKCGRDVSELMARMCLQVGCPAKLQAEYIPNANDTTLGIETLLTSMRHQTLPPASTVEAGFSTEIINNSPEPMTIGFGEGGGGGASAAYDSCSDSSSSSSSSDCGSTDT